MTKQERIRKGLAEMLRGHVGGSWHTRIADEVINYLHKQGVVLKMNKPDADFYYEPLIWEVKDV